VIGTGCLGGVGLLGAGEGLLVLPLLFVPLCCSIEMVGRTIFPNVGEGVGAREGFGVGFRDGSFVGLGVDLPFGFLVGFLVGFAVGFLVGSAVGFGLGLGVKDLLGACGAGVGTLVDPEGGCLDVGLLVSCVAEPVTAEGFGFGVPWAGDFEGAKSSLLVLRIMFKLDNSSTSLGIDAATVSSMS